jgi:sulfur carrier protein ThiS
MQVKIILHGVLREKLSPENKGIASLEITESSTISDLLSQLDIPQQVKCSINEELERDFDRVLKDGDEVRCFRPIGGG